MNTNTTKMSKTLTYVRIISILMLILCPLSSTYAQRVVTGTVKNDKGEILIGVTIKLNYSVVATTTDMDGAYKLKISEDVIDPVLEFSYLGYTNKTIKVNNRSVIDVILEEKTVIQEEIMYSQEAGITLMGGLSDVNFGAGIYFRGFQLSRFLHIPTHTYFVGEASYYTDFSDNSRIKAKLRPAPRSKYLQFDVLFNRYNIPSKSINMNIYKMDYLLPTNIYFKHRRLNMSLSTEYINQRYREQQDQVSIMGAVHYATFPISENYVQIGVSQHGKVQALGGVYLYPPKNIPIDCTLEIGYYLDRLRYKGELSHRSLRWSLAVGYEQLYKYRNAYVSLRIPLEKFASGVSYVNYLKRDKKE